MSKTEANILIIDDDPDVLQTAKFSLKQHFTQVIADKDPGKIPFHLNDHPFDIILLDMNFKPGVTSGEEGLEWLRQIGNHHSTPGVIMITAYGEIDLAVEAMKYGAVDFVVKPWENEKLIATVNTAFQLIRSRREVEELKVKNRELSKTSSGEVQLIGNSEGMKALVNLVKKVSPTDADILLLGENGTGKEVVAKMIHQFSERNDKPLIKVDIGAITESLFESELFGHVKGAFTDAKEDRIGRFELASGGTLFLDEIGNLGKDIQSKLLSALQNREVFRVGSSRAIPVDIRLICATNTPLIERVDRGLFREDLYYRLNTFEITIPPLRERIEDVQLLAGHFLKRYERKYHHAKLTITKSGLKLFASHKWPGNIRELEHSIERAVILLEPGETRIGKEHIQLGKKPITAIENNSLNLEDIEKKTIETAIARHSGNMSKVAADLGMGRTTLYRKIRKYGF